MKKLLPITALFEVATGLALMMVPVLVGLRAVFAILLGHAWLRSPTTGRQNHQTSEQ